MNPTVKEERLDEAEIQEMAAKMIEAYRAKAQQLATKPAPTNRQPENLQLLNLISRNLRNDSVAGSVMSSINELTPSLGDEESVSGRFGWVTLGKEHIPYITRSNEKYCAVRMVEMRVLNKYLAFLHQDICNCTCIRSYYITEAESRLLNEINIKHCDLQFGREQFTCRDLIVRLSDAIEFHLFLDSVYTKLLTGATSEVNRCGFIRINNDSVVPYTIYKEQKYVPLFYFEGETETLKLKADKLEGWDLAYLKFCCKVQGIRNELFAHDSCSVIGLSDIRNYFPPDTLFDDYWPSKVVDTQLLINGKAQTQLGQWTRQPAGAPPITSNQQPQSPQPTVEPKVLNNTSLQNVPAMFPNYSLAAAQPTYPVVPPRSTNTAIRGSSFVSSAASSRNIRPPFYTMASAAAAVHPPPVAMVRAPQTSRGNSEVHDFNIDTSTLNPRSGSARTQPYPSNVVPSNYLMLSDSSIVPATYRQTGPQIPKYPQSLIPMQQMNGEVHYEPSQNHYRSNDIVDLSGQNRSLPPQITSQHEQPTQSQQKDEHQNMPNGRPSPNNANQKLVPIADILTSGPHIPYKMHKAYRE